MDSKLKNLYKQFSDSGQMVLSANAKQRVKNRVFQRLGETRMEPEPAVSLWLKIRNSVLLKSYVLVPLVVVLLVITTGAASAHALPGDVLYPVKRQVESARVLLAPTADAKLELEFNFAEERLREFEEIQAAAGIQAEPENSGNSTNSSQVNASVNAGANVQKDNESENHANSGSNSRSSQRQIQARQQAEGALNFLQQTKAGLQGHTDSRSQDLDKKLDQKIEDYQDRLVKKNANGSSNSGDTKTDSPAPEIQIKF